MAAHDGALGQAFVHGHAHTLAQLGRPGQQQAQPGLGVRGVVGQQRQVRQHVAAQVLGLVDDEPMKGGSRASDLPVRTSDGAPVHCERHRPERTTLYRRVQQHAASFNAHTEAGPGAELPQFLEAEPGKKQSGGLLFSPGVPGEEPGLWPGAACRAEFAAFHECGILAHGFLRLRCGERGRDMLLAFSCKCPGFCRS
jgi:hypothetical protein